ncbi:beta-1,6-galactosyltransferase GALT29A isoform X2 [Lycium ferocissimum]|uniref:beta-1,6-galactosyltransferase GALT29A isoform X2 n=1 Tax=Lycium ferocissimum TaxID=112874 RepID=UPI002815C577|nr:beta-1,6-galactosyltransferase GALT29A isoform X2 [Lycium ferocissimum]
MMKRTMRPLFSVLLLIAVAATLAVRVTLRYSSIELKNEYPFAKKPVLNETLLKYASIDIGEPQLKKDVEELLEGNFRSGHNRHRSFLSSGKYRIDIRPRTARGIPVQLRSPEFYRLWQSFRRHLQDWYRNRKVYKDVMVDLVNTMGLKKRYKSCAVVGNSGILLKSVYGELIDSHEAVIRLNNARTGGFEHRVGSKTTLSFVNSNILHLCARREGCFCHSYGVNVGLVMYICQPVHFLDYMVCNSSHKAPLIVTDSRFDMLCAKVVKYYSLKRFVEGTGKSLQEWGPAHDGANFHYSSGFQAVMLALGVCEKVSVFGFGKSTSAKHHYHTNQRAELKLHDYDAEYDLYRDLVERPQASVSDGAYIDLIHKERR